MIVRDEVYDRAEGLCECTLRGCSHHGQCSQPLRGDWEIYRLDPAVVYNLSNLVALCEACSRRARGGTAGPLPGF
jgi:hypothetical protein